MKKMLSILLAVVLALSVCTVVAFAVDNDIVITVGSVSGNPGDTVAVPISITSNAGFNTLALELSYDADVLEIYCPNHVEGEGCTDNKAPAIALGNLGTVIDTNAAGGTTNANGYMYMSSQYHTVNPYKMQWAFLYTTENITYTGVVATVTFKIKDTAAIGDTNVTVSVDSENTVNVSGTELTADSANGKVTVNSDTQLDFVYGDANGDTYIDGRDVVRIKNYLANYDYDTETSSVEIFEGADANGDTYIDGRDVIRLQNYLANYDFDTESSTVVLGPQS